MTLSAYRCVFILSAKSSGSSMLQRVLRDRFGARTVASTRHFENETLYWTKAASVLDMPQQRMPRSEVPIRGSRAFSELRAFLRQHAGGFSLETADKESLIAGFKATCAAHAPLFVEKSPHHLYQSAALELMSAFADSGPPGAVLFLGLVRNPIDTLYSSWRRFGVPPHIEEPFWRSAYENLSRFAESRPHDVAIIRYEDLARGAVDLSKILSRLDVTEQHDCATGFDMGSVARWRRDSQFRFTPSEATISVASRYGYRLNEMIGNPGPWPIKARLRSTAFLLLGLAPSPLVREASSLWRRLRPRSTATSSHTSSR